MQESTDCLTRESRVVKDHDNVRRNRKALLSELSSLVKSSKRLQDWANGEEPDGPVDNIFDEMLLKALKVVTRSVRFFDVWMEEIELPKVIEQTTEKPMPPPPPAPVAQSIDPSTTDQSDTGIAASVSQKTLTQMPQASVSRSSPTKPPQQTTFAKPQRASVPHRVSYIASANTRRGSNYASERLASAHDSFLSLLGAFIGLHMQSRSSGELIGTTQASVKACRRLLTVVDKITESDNHRSQSLREAQDIMYQKITTLVHAARDAFSPALSQGEEIFFMSGDGRPLVEAATECVRAAGECVTKAKVVLERIGDFDMGSCDSEMSDMDHSAEATAETESSETSATPADTSVATETAATHFAPLPLPPLLMPNDSPLSATPSLSDGFTHSTVDCMSDATTDRSSVHSTVAPLMNISTPQSSFDSYSSVEHDVVSRTHKCSFASTGSTGTYVNSMRNSEVSAFSQASTRAASLEYQSTSDGYCRKISSESLDGPEVAEGVLMETTFAHEIMLNKDGQVIGGTLRALIERLTVFQSTPDAIFVSTFYLTFRLFATPQEFALALEDRFNYIRDSPQTAGPVRLRVYNIFKGWLESHWRHEIDSPALADIMRFANTSLSLYLPSAGKRLAELAEKVSAVNGPLVPRLVSSIGKTNTSIASYVSPEVPFPAPLISKSQMNTLKSWKNGKASLDIWEFEPLELARQLTLKASKLFCSILPEELLATEWNKKRGSLAVNVRAMTTLSTDLTNLVADSILQLEEPKRRAAVIKCWVKVANKCLELNNYDSLMAIVCSLNTSFVSRLKRTWELVSQKTKQTLDSLRNIVDVSRNYSVLRQRLQNHVAPCLPFLGVYLTDLTFVDHGNQATRQLIPTTSPKAKPITVINFDKHMKTARTISELQRFQIPYRIAEVPELQAWMQDQLVRVRSEGDKSFQDHYRRSLALEPREFKPADSIVSMTGSTAGSVSSVDNKLHLPATKEKFDFFQWTHSSHSHSSSRGSESEVREKENVLGASFGSTH